MLKLKLQQIKEKLRGAILFSDSHVLFHSTAAVVGGCLQVWFPLTGLPLMQLSSSVFITKPNILYITTKPA